MWTRYRLFYRALLQKRRIVLRSLLIVATPSVITCSVVRDMTPWDMTPWDMSRSRVVSHTAFLTPQVKRHKSSESHICVTRPIHSVLHTISSYVVPCMTWLVSIHMCDKTIHSHMGGCLHVGSLAEYPLFYRALLQKRPVILSHIWMRSLHGSYMAPHPYVWQNYRSFLQKSPIKERIFCQRDLWF